MDSRKTIRTWSTGGIRAILFRMLVLSMVGAAAWASLLPLVRSNPVFGDEPGWIAASSYSADLVLAGRFDWSLWNEPSFQAYGPLNPPIGKLALGLPMRIGASEPSFRRLWDWSLDEKGNRLAGNLPPPEDFLTARKFAAMHAALLVVVVCAVGWAVGGLSVGLLGAGLLCLHPVWRETGSMVLTDMILCAVLLATVFPAIRLLRKAPDKPGIGPLVVLGLLLGVAGAIKPTGLVLGSAFAGVLLVHRAIASRRFRAFAKGAVVVMVCSGTALVALDPWLWPRIDATSPGAILREAPAAIGILRSPHALSSWENDSEEIAAVQSLFRPAYLLVRAKNWKHLVALQRTLPSLQWESPRLVALLDWLFLRQVAFPGEPLFFLLGFVVLAAALAKGARSPREESRIWLAPILFTAAAIAYTFVLVILPVPRYLLPLHAILQLFAAKGILSAVEFATRRLRRAFG